jgi:hypothetical protein
MFPGTHDRLAARDLHLIVVLAAEEIHSKARYRPDRQCATAFDETARGTSVQHPNRELAGESTELLLFAWKPTRPPNHSFPVSAATAFGPAVSCVSIDPLQRQFMFDAAVHQPEATGRHQNAHRLSNLVHREGDRQHVSGDGRFMAHGYELVVQNSFDDDIARHSQHPTRIHKIHS